MTASRVTPATAQAPGPRLASRLLGPASICVLVLAQAVLWTVLLPGGGRSAHTSGSFWVRRPSC
jgi:hypothetical protein